MTTKITEDECDDVTKALGRKLYENYTANSDNKNYRGEECPPWNLLSPAVRGHWCRIALETHNIAWQAWHRRSEGPYDPHSDGRARHEEAQGFATWWKSRA